METIDKQIKLIVPDFGLVVSVLSLGCFCEPRIIAHKKILNWYKFYF